MQKSSCRFFTLTLALIAAYPELSHALPLGALSLDGPPTPEQISLVLPVTGALPTTATATVRYKTSASATWITGHPLHRVRPNFAEGGGPTVEDVFAWPIIDLSPGTSYDVEVSVTSAGVTDVKTLSTTTRSFPPASGAATINVPAGSTAAQIQAAISSAPAGAVVQIANGTYNLTSAIGIANTNGTANNPVYVRGASRTGTVLANNGTVFQVLDASNVVIEQMTLRGSGVDSGGSAASQAVTFYNGVPVQRRLTFRNLTITGVDLGIVAASEVDELLIYDNTLTGNNRWTQDLHPNGGDGVLDLLQNHFWNDDGIGVGGQGNAVFNNTLSGFGDTLTVSVGSEHPTSKGVHFYRNDILMSGDDTYEGDFGFRNLTLYDNRIRNCGTLASFDPLYGGPALIARNIAINPIRGPYKLNASNTGHFLYNNTVIRTVSGLGGDWGWLQFNNGAQQAWGYQNNILILRGGGNPMAFESSGNDPADFTHNSWFPDGQIWWSSSGGSFSSLAAAAAGISSTTPVFSGATKRHQSDNITTSNPFTTTITLGATHLIEVTTDYVPTLAAGSSPKNSGTVIANVTDGFSGAAPDRGAIISGRPVPVWGDRGSSGTQPGTPMPPTALTAN